MSALIEAYETNTFHSRAVLENTSTALLQRFFMCSSAHVEADQLAGA